MQKMIRLSGKKLLALAAMLLLTVGAAASAMAAGVNATVVLNGRETRVSVQSTETEDILEQAGVALRASDKVVRSDEDGIRIEVSRTVPVRIYNGTFWFQRSVHFGDTVAEALEKAGVAYDGNDIVSPSPRMQVYEGMEITVSPRHQVTVTADGVTQSFLAEDGTVGDALLEAKVMLGLDDEVSPPRGTPLEEGMEIRVGRVTYREVTAEEAIPYTTLTNESDAMMRGTTRVETAGVDGLRRVTRREKLVDGEVSSSEVLESVVLRQPVQEVVTAGTRVDPSPYATIEADGRVYDRYGKEVKYTTYLSGKCTAYTSNGGTTATGRKAAEGLVAVDPDVIPYGTELYICSADGKTVYGYAIAADTGGAMLSGRILADVYYDTLAECYDFGVRDMRVYILA